MNKILGFDIVPMLQVTYLLDDATFNLVKDKPSAAIGQAVALVGDATVGFGTKDDKILGIIEHVESDKYATIRTGFYAEGVKMNATTPPAVGEVVKVDGEGGILKATTQTNYGPTVIRIDGDGAVLKF